jgi:hypothetical protein
MGNLLRKNHHVHLVLIAATILSLIAVFIGMSSPVYAASSVIVQQGDICPTPTPAQPAPVYPWVIASVNNNTQQDESCIVDVYLSRSRYPAAAQHIQDAIASGQPAILTLDRPGAVVRHNAAMVGHPLCGGGLDRDEYPMAVSLEGGTGADVRCIPFSDNRGAGATIGAQLTPYPDGTRFRIVITA